MVNFFPDYVQHDTPPGRKASWLYISMLLCSLLAATLYYSLITSPLIKTATSNDEFFGLEMYEGTTGCTEWCVPERTRRAAAWKKCNT
jgi:peptidoglycan/LPS O-acetylase OafA/YrhL